MGLSTWYVKVIIIRIQTFTNNLQTNQYDFMLEAESMSTLGVDLIRPLDMSPSTGMLNMPHEPITSLWTSPNS